MAVSSGHPGFDDGQPFLIHNVDILSNINLRELVKQHRQSNSVATLVCSERETSRYLLFDEIDRLRGWVNEKTGEVKTPVAHREPSPYRKLAFSGIHLLRPSLFEQMEEMPDTFSIIDFYIQYCDQVVITSYAPKDANHRRGKTGSIDRRETFFKPIHARPLKGKNDT